MIQDEEDYLAHYGTLRKSGRYPWGSGSGDKQGIKSFLDHIADLRDKGLSDVEIATGLGMSTTKFRSINSIAKNQNRQAEINEAVKLKEKGYSNIAIGTKMGKNESSVRSLLSAHLNEKLDILTTTANMLRDEVNKGGFIQVGKGVEQQLAISKERLGSALAILKAEGYEVHPVQVDQLGTRAGSKTIVKVLAPPGTTYRDVVKNMNDIRLINATSDDGGRSYFGMLPPLSVSSDRVDIKYGEDGGDKADGIIYVRPGVKDVSLGNARYAQVRIDVDGTHYLKGVALYKNDLPPGVDLMFNTTKSNTGNKLDAMKEQSGDPDNPFGAVVSQIGDRNDKGHITKVTSAMNVVYEEGDWDKWSRTLSSQTLSKQSSTLAKTQLNMTYEKKRAELDEIMSLTNPAVRKKLLETFSDSADASAIHLQAAKLPRSSWHVITPFNSMKEDEVYAPNFRNGERVALIRYPHGGKFEIPELIVNNSHTLAKATLGEHAKDAIGINAVVAKRLSGADFDGDAVMVIPNTKGSLKTAPALKGLENFDPQTRYKLPDDAPKMSLKTKGKQMGDVSNLITDMTIRGAKNDELAAAVRHSMVVIDAENHHLDYKQSAIDNGIRNLKTIYQEGPRSGASTLISRAKAQVNVPKRIPRPASEGGAIDKATGRKVFKPTGETYDVTTVSKRTGEVKTKIVDKTQRSVRLAETHDAHTLVSEHGGTAIEKVYADHSNKLKALANEARKEAVNTPPVKVSDSAKKVYAPEVKSLTAKLNVALENSPRERQAQLLGNTTLLAKKQANPDMDETQIKKIKSQALEEARRRVNAKKVLVEIEPREWDAIQAGAISNSRLKSILDNSNIEQVKKLATPKTALLMTSTKLSRARSMAASGYTQAEIADALGVSLTTLKTGLRDG